MVNQHARSNKPPTQKSGRRYPKLSAIEKDKFLDEMKNAVKMGAVKLAPGNTVEMGNQTSPATPHRRTANPKVVAWLLERMKTKDHREAAMRQPTGRVQ